MRRFTLITIIGLLIVLAAVAVYQISLGTSVEDRLRGPTPTETPQVSPGI